MTSLNAAERSFIEQLCIGSEPETVTNPYSGEQVTLCPTAAALYDCIMGAEALCDTAMYCRAQKLMCKLYPVEYRALVD